MSLARYFFRLLRPRGSAAFEAAVDRLRHSHGSEVRMSKPAVVSALRAIAAKRPSTPEELVEVEAESFVLCERLRKSSVGNDWPHVVWHFLADADIRFKDLQYRDAQVRQLAASLAAWDRDGI